MFSAILPDRPVSAASMADLVRPVIERAVQPVNPPTPVDAAQTQFGDRRPQREQQPPVPTEPGRSGTIFAAAVLSGALLPRPATLSQLYARIGASPIPEESELRLRDLQV